MLGVLKIRIEFQLVEQEYEASNEVELISCAEGRYHVFQGLVCQEAQARKVDVFLGLSAIRVMKMFQISFPIFISFPLTHSFLFDALKWKIFESLQT